MILALLMALPCRAGERSDTAVVLTVGARAVTAGEFERYYAGNSAVDTCAMSRRDYALMLADYLRKIIAAEDAGLDTLAVVSAEVQGYAASLSLPLTDPDVRDFRDGLLVYEMTRRTVEIPARTDTAALNRYFLARRDDFGWKRPRLKGCVLAAVSDSLADAAVAWLDAVSVDADGANVALRRRFGKGVKVERVLAPQGVSVLVDSLIAFRRATDSTGLWRAFRLIDGRLIEAPESVEDVRGLVAEAYRRILQQQWLDTLRRRYPAVVLFD